MPGRGIDGPGAALRERWLADPADFAERVLGIRPWDLPNAPPAVGTQRRVLSALRPGARISWRSSHKVGKSTTAAIAAIWAATLFPRSRVVLTAPTYRQVSKVLWREVRRLHAGARLPLGGAPSLLPSSGWNLPNGSQVLGFTTKDDNAFSGISAPLVTYIVDEAAGVPEEIFEAIDGNSAGGSILIMLGNPTRLSGRFRRSQTTERAGASVFHTSAHHVIEATGGRKIPGLATQEWVREMAQEYGETSNVYAVRVLGEFPEHGSNSVLPLSMIDRAADRRLSPSETDRLELGADPARYGDDATAIVARRGLYVYPVVTLRNADSHEVAGRILALCRELHMPGDRQKPLIKVDEIGIGAGVLDTLRRDRSVEAVGVNSAAAAREPNRYANCRDELWFSLLSFMRDGGAIPRDADLIAELSSAEYTFDGRGRQKVESKDEMKKKLGRSPDRADALALSVYAPRVFVPRPLFIPGL